MNIRPIAHFRSPLTSKFGIPRQSGLAPSLRGRIVFEPSFCNDDYIRGIEDFDYLWLIWNFSANAAASIHATVRPPLLGGNVRMGVFATRSPFRPNGLGLSSVRLLGVERTGGQLSLLVAGADLMDGTPIYDIKPYLSYADSHPDARAGFTDAHAWRSLRVVIPHSIGCKLAPNRLAALTEVLALDPRPSVQHATDKVFGMPFDHFNVRFTVANDTLTVTEISENR